ncbi:phage integrase central domain-containing protein [Neisseria sp. Ec49-e6-T10]|uniref:phage integrase central domain-containing protein n=1 Tax=Neisseria sp. Ec49-e6-T10 TaxID=3140744 RepID=UPI003EBC1793
MDAFKSGWKNAKHEQQWSSTLNTYAFPIIGKVIVSQIDTNIVLDVLNPIWSTKTETAYRLRGRIEKILDWAKVKGFRDGEKNTTQL